MATYEVVQLVEMTVLTRVRADSAEEANDLASLRTQRLCKSIAKRYPTTAFGDIDDSYIPARDDSDAAPEE